MPNLLFFEGNKPHFNARNKLDKVETVGGSNNAEVWGRTAGGQRGFGGGSSDAEAIFLHLFQKKIRIFKHTLV